MLSNKDFKIGEKPNFSEKCFKLEDNINKETLLNNTEKFNRFNVMIKNSKLVVMLENNPSFITFIFVVFFLQIFVLYYHLFVLIFNLKLKFDWTNKIVNHSIETAPYFGILGTIYSFATVASNSSSEKITVLFKAGFENAILTTIVGGVIFIFAISLDYATDNK